MSHPLSSYQSHAHAVLRIVAGFLFLWHGLSKLLGVPVPAPEAPAFVIWVGGLIELIGGGLVMVGFLARWAAFVCSGMMAAAYWTVHYPQGLLPIQNQGELAALYCFVFLFIAAAGPGIWSVDGAGETPSK